MSIWFDDGVNHDIVDDEDDRRILVARCGERFSYTFRSSCCKHPYLPNEVTCLLCILNTYENDVWGW